MGLQNRFKERRRTKKPRTTKVQSEDVKPQVQKGPAVNTLELPPIPVGEDKTSFERHNRVLKQEYAKTHPNVSVVKELMKTTFAMRRRDLLSHGHSYDIIGKYPCLQSPDHVCDT